MTNSTPLRVLAIDPGYDRVGVAIMELNSGKESLLYSTCIETNAKDTLITRIHHIATTLEGIINTHSPNTLAIETLFFNKNAKTAIGVAQARGVIVYVAQKAECAVYEFGPQEIKVATTGHGGSDKAAMIAMVRRLVPLAPVAAHDDEYDAIAVGITCLAHHGRGR